MSMVGQKIRFYKNTGTSQAPAWKKLKGEVSVSTSETSGKVEKLNKDSGKHKAYVKTQLDSTLTITADYYNQSDIGADELGWAEMRADYAKTQADAAYEFEYKIEGAETGLHILTKLGFVESCSFPAEVNGIVKFDVGIQFQEEGTVAEVA